MKRQQFNDTINDFKQAGNQVYGYYIGYRPFDSATSQKWGKISELESVLDGVEKCETCVDGNLPIIRLIIYSDTQCLVFAENKYWDSVNEPEEVSHVVTVAPYIAKDGWFGNEIISERVNNNKNGD